MVLEQCNSISPISSNVHIKMSVHIKIDNCKTKKLIYTFLTNGIDFS